MKNDTPIILQYNTNSSIQNLGGIAVYPNEFNKALLELDLGNELWPNIRSGSLLYGEFTSKIFDTSWRILLGGLRRITDSPFPLLGSIGYFCIQKYLTMRFSNHKASRKNIIYHHMNNFVLPELALIRIAKKFNVFLVTTIVDLQEVDYPEFLPQSTHIFRRHLKNFLKQSTHYFIPITNFIKRDAINSGLFSNQSNCAVIEWGTDHIGVSRSVRESKSAIINTLQDPIISKPFFLFPAKAWAHKGHLEFLKAYGENSAANFNVVFIGDLEPLREEIGALVLMMGAKGIANIKIIGFVDDDTREQLMRDCRAVILPSCYEGFGFPYFEATFLKKALVCFRTKSYVEFFGEFENSVTVSNQDFAAFIEALINFNEHLASEETERKLARIQELTWKSCLNKTLDVYTAVLQKIS